MYMYSIQSANSYTNSVGKRGNIMDRYNVYDTSAVQDVLLFREEEDIVKYFQEIFSDINKDFPNTFENKVRSLSDLKDVESQVSQVILPIEDITTVTSVLKYMIKNNNKFVITSTSIIPIELDNNTLTYTMYNSSHSITSYLRIDSFGTVKKLLNFLLLNIDHDKYKPYRELHYTVTKV